jgi:Flp pilus assembly protein TadD/TolB-like protein
LLAGGAVLWSRRSKPATAERVQSVAVLPFRDLSGTAEGRVLADGIAELIAARIAEVPALRVSTPFNGVEAMDEGDPGVAARRRGVHAIVRGTVQRAEEQIRVTYSMIEAATGETLASSTVTKPVTALFALEDAVAEDLVRVLGRQPVPRIEAASATLGPNDQRRFVEAVGLLQRVRDEKSVDQAITILESILRNARESGSVNSLLARALLYKAALARRPALIEQATVYASRGIALSASDPDSYVTMGRLQNASGRHAEAVATFQRALSLRPNSPDATAGLAEAYERQGRGEDAERLYKRAIDLRPDAPGTYSRYGAFLYAQGRHADAAAQFAKVVELAPQFSHAHSDLGAAQQALGRHDDALASYRRSLAIDPTAAGWSNLGTLQFFLGRYPEAVASYQHAATLAPSDSYVLANLGDARSANGDKQGAADAWTRATAAARDALTVNPGDSVLRAVYASCLAKGGNVGDAQREIRRALEADPTNADVLYQAATVGALRGNAETAMSWLERALRAGYPAEYAERDPLLEPIRRAQRERRE